MVQCRLIRRLESVLRIWTLGDTTLDSGLWTLDFGLWTLDSGLWTLDFGLWTLDSGLRTQDFGLRTQDSGLRTLDSGLPTPDDATAFEMERAGEKLFNDPSVGGDVAGGMGKGVVAAKKGHPDHEVIGGVEIHCTTVVYCVL
jgi:hypothetical protein